MKTETRRTYEAEWKKKNRARLRVSWKKWYDKTSAKALEVVGRGIVACVRCGEDDVDRLEINHKNGGGNIERRLSNMRGANLRLKVATGARHSDDLELLCRPCNLVHAAEQMSGRKYVLVK